MNNQQAQFFVDTLQRYKKTFFGFSAGFCCLMAGQSQPIDAATPKDAQKPLKNRQNIAKLIDELNARCENSSLLDKLKSRQAPTNLLAPDEKSDVLGGGDDCPGLVVPSIVYTDSGTTLGANNTNTSVPANCNGTYTQTAGPDKIYQIYLPAIAYRTGVCTVTVDPTGANWDPSIYLLTNCADGNSCGAGRGDDNGGSNVTESVNLATVPGGTYYFFVDSFYASGALSAGSYDFTLNCPATPPTSAGVSVGGRITSPNGGVGLGRISVTATDSNGVVRYATTNSLGFYKFDALPAGDTYVFEVSSKKYQFSNPTQVVSVSDNIADLNFEVIE